MFRPSDDACTYPLFAPANLFAVVSVRQLATLASQVLKDVSLSQEAQALAAEVEAAVQRYGKTQHAKYGCQCARTVEPALPRLLRDQ